MIEQLVRTVKRVEIDHLIYEGDHQFILNGIMNGMKKLNMMFLIWLTKNKNIFQF